MKSEILICSNERIFNKDTNFFCENLDIKSIPEGLSKNYETYYRNARVQLSNNFEGF